jgi:hypothetical protein
MLLTRLKKIINDIDTYLRKYTNLTLTTMIIDENLSINLYGNKNHIGEEIDLFELKDLIEPNIFRSRL